MQMASETEALAKLIDVLHAWRRVREVGACWCQAGEQCASGQRRTTKNVCVCILFVCERGYIRERPEVGSTRTVKPTENDLDLGPAQHIDYRHRLDLLGALSQQHPRGRHGLRKGGSKQPAQSCVLGPLSWTTFKINVESCGVVQAEPDRRHNRQSHECMRLAGWVGGTAAQTHGSRAQEVVGHRLLTRYDAYGEKARVNKRLPLFALSVCATLCIACGGAGSAKYSIARHARRKFKLI
jgi:hypothetical protein